jgi:hypothetical protein
MVISMAIREMGCGGGFERRGLGCKANICWALGTAFNVCL